MLRHSRRVEDEMVARQRRERIRLPKIQQKEAKIRMNMFKKSLRISSVYQDPLQSVSQKDKIKKVISHFSIPAFFSQILMTSSSTFVHLFLSSESDVINRFDDVATPKRSTIL